MDVDEFEPEDGETIPGKTIVFAIPQDLTSDSSWKKFHWSKQNKIVLLLKNL